MTSNFKSFDEDLLDVPKVLNIESLHKSRRKFLEKAICVGLSSVTLGVGAEIYTPSIASAQEGVQHDYTSGGYYTFTLEKFHISKTRSRHNDTDTVAIGLEVGNQMLLVLNRHMGDVNDGDHPVALSYNGIAIPHSTPIKFNYQIINAGHVDLTVLNNLLNQGAGALVAVLAPTGIWALVAGGALAGFKKILDLLNANCDGYVAADQISTSGATLKSWTDKGIHRESRYYPGSDSPSGCGANSQYTVTWSVSSIKGQDNWRWCKKCMGLFYNGFSSPGRCPTGGMHDGTSSWNYNLLANTEGFFCEIDWRWCKKCMGLFLISSVPPGRCPAGGIHDGTSSWIYNMVGYGYHSGQDNWRMCSKCTGLFYNGFSSPGSCPAGGMHNGTSSSNYSLLTV